MIESIHLQGCGVALLLLAALNIYLPRRFGWRQELKQVSLFTRQVFFVHSLFIFLLLVLMGLLDVVLAEELLQPSRLSAAILGGLALFWGVRLVVQWFVYDRSLWRGKRFETTVHVVFTFLWLALAGIHGVACWEVLRA